MKLSSTPAADRRIAVVLANYPNRDGRIGNGVGLDTPAGTMTLLRAMQDAGYHVAELPDDGNALVERLLNGPTNAGVEARRIEEMISLADYQVFFSRLPKSVRDAVTQRWGTPEADPFFIDGDTDCGAFAVPVFRCGNIAFGLQPARGYNIDPEKTYHDPDLVPPHGYLAFYAWIRARLVPMPSSIWASMAISNGCRASRWHCRRIVSRKPRSARCRMSIRSSSTTPAKAPS